MPRTQAPRLAPIASTILLRALLLALCLAALGSCKPAAEPPAEPAPEPTMAGFSTNPYCPTGVVLCSTLPGPQIDVPPGCNQADQQCSRDFWSWQTFVSLNWPGQIVDGPGGTKVVQPDPNQSVGDAGSRVWELWMDPDSVFLPGAPVPAWTPGQGPPSPCGYPEGAPASPAGKRMVGRLAKASVGLGDLDPDDFFEATVNQPLIDQAMEFVVFEVRMSQTEVGWVVDNGLYQQETVQGLTSSLTLPGDALEAKAAWRILPASMPESQKARYYREQATIVLSPEHVQGGGSQPVCITRELGLVGLHLRHNGLWSTFEQVDNVTPSTGITPTFNNPGCTGCTVNVAPTDKNGNPIPTDDYQWSLKGPSASLYQGFPNVPSQITRAPGQDEFIDGPMNTWFQQSVLGGTVWANYMLITTNWTEFTDSQPIPTLNTSLEPYIPSNSQYPQACIDCHKFAKNANGAEIGMTFMPFRACPKSPQPGQKLPPNCVPGGVTTLAAHR
jgi:hypothetical protein